MDETHETVTFTSQRTFGGNCVQLTLMWSERLVANGLVILFVDMLAWYFGADIFRKAGLDGIRWFTLGLLGAAIGFCAATALKSWINLSVARRIGMPIFKFDSKGISCDNGTLHTSTPWSGIDRLKLTRGACFVYVTPTYMSFSHVWFFRRDELSPPDQTLLLNFVRASNVRFKGAWT